MNQMNTYDKCNKIRNSIMILASRIIIHDDWRKDLALKDMSALTNEFFDHEKLGDIQPNELTIKQVTALGFTKHSDENPIWLIPAWLFPFLSDKVKCSVFHGDTRIIDKRTMKINTTLGTIPYGITPKKVNIDDQHKL